MNWRSLFNINVTGVSPAAVTIPGKPYAAAKSSPPQHVGSFVTPQSLTTFSGMTVAITLIWTFVEVLCGLGHLLWLGAIISTLCGALLYWTDLSDPKRTGHPTTPMRVFAAVVNTILLFNAACGSYDFGARAFSRNTSQSIAPATGGAPAPR